MFESRLLVKTEKAIVDDKCDKELNNNELAIFDYLVHTYKRKNKSSK